MTKGRFESERRRKGSLAPELEPPLLDALFSVWIDRRIKPVCRFVTPRFTASRDHLSARRSRRFKRGLRLG